jgi:hypothetical protein
MFGGLFNCVSNSAGSGLSFHRDNLLPTCFQSTTTSFSLRHAMPLLIRGFATGFGGFGGGSSSDHPISSRSKNCGGSAHWNAAAFRIPLSLSARRSFIRWTWCWYWICLTARNKRMNERMSPTMTTPTPMPALAPVLRPGSANGPEVIAASIGLLEDVVVWDVECSRVVDEAGAGVASSGVDVALTTCGLAVVLGRCKEVRTAISSGPRRLSSPYMEI